ncbi:MAG: acetylglutamate kinase [Clostridia bacterium]|nr:acetylglutamate kinase [Clostridia bacterium]
MNKDSRYEILLSALPYIQQWANKTVVVKYGGHAMQSEKLCMSLMRDLVLLNSVGIKVVLVHGGGPQIDELLKLYGKKSKFINGLRYTDEETMQVVKMALAGDINKNLVSAIEKQGGEAVGLCGIDGKILIAEKIEEPDLGFVGKIKKVNCDFINLLLDNSYIPVISTIAVDEQMNAYNVNADYAATRIASELHAEKFILMTDIEGIRKDVDDPSTLISKIDISDLPKLKEEGVISGGMIPKVDSCAAAIRQGVNSVHILNGTTEHSILIELFSKEGIGTMFQKI